MTLFACRILLPSGWMRQMLHFFFHYKSFTEKGKCFLKIFFNPLDSFYLVIERAVPASRLIACLQCLYLVLCISLTAVICNHLLSLNYISPMRLANFINLILQRIGGIKCFTIIIWLQGSVRIRQGAAQRPVLGLGTRMAKSLQTCGPRQPSMDVVP